MHILLASLSVEGQGIFFANGPTDYSYHLSYINHTHNESPMISSFMFLK